MKKITICLILIILNVLFILSCNEEGTDGTDTDPLPDSSVENDQSDDADDQSGTIPDTDPDIETDTDTDIDSAPVYELLDAAAAYALVNERKEDTSFHIIDVRSSSEFSTGHIENAENYNVYDVSFSDNIGKLKKDDAFFVYCASGSRSKGAVSTMKELGFVELYELSGGISSWKNAGYPTETE